MPATYDSIATTTLGSSATTYTFSSIPQTYTDLTLIFAGSATNNINLRFNGDTGSNYSTTRLTADGSGVGGVGSDRFSNATFIIGPYDPGTVQVSIWQIMGYSDSTKNKTAFAKGGGSTQGVAMDVGLWRNTNAITSVTVHIDGAYSMGAGSIISLYGIKAA
jgi:hypothetical protein